MMVYNKKILFAIFLGLLMLVCFGYVPLLEKLYHKQHQLDFNLEERRTSGQKICSNERDIKCFSVHYLKLLEINKYANFADILKDVNDRNINNEIDATICHELLHNIGEKYFSIYKNFSNISVLERNITNSICGSGFTHGVILEFSKSNPNSDYFYSEIGKYYDSIVQNVNAKQNVEEDTNTLIGIHGIGHIFREYNTDALDGVKDCKKLSESSILTDMCLSGLYMQDSYNMNYVFPGYYPKACLQQPHEDRYTCFNSISYPKSDFNTQLGNYIFQCNSVDDFKEKLACINSLTFSFLKYEKFSFEKVHSYCSNFKEFKNYCLAQVSATVLQTYKVQIENKELNIPELVCSGNNFLPDYIACKYMNSIVSKQKFYLLKNTQDYYDSIERNIRMGILAEFL